VWQVGAPPVLRDPVTKQMVMDENDFWALRQRVGDEPLGRRLRAQVDRTLRLRGMGRGGYHFENVSLFIDLVGVFLRLTGLYRIGERNALALSVHDHPVSLSTLPPQFDGLRILHLSDLHLDGYRGFGQRIAHELQGQQFDLVVITGDFRLYDTGRYEQIGAELAALMPALACRLGVYGILGNHDFIEMVPLIERAGVRLLLNESAPVQVDGATLWLVGLDDAHFYGLHDFDKAVQDMPAGAPRLLLVHSPEVIPEAAARGFALYLTGHTHAGQICLPGGFAPYMNVRCKRSQIAGEWRHGALQGYTSAGVGASGAFVRFFCPPEIVIHELHAIQ
jgi:predicted MPP superfamily phosphohydrolase